MRSILLLALATALCAGPSLAQSSSSAGAITIERAVTVNAVQPMSFAATGSSSNAVSSGAMTEAIFEVTGDPGRVYRVRLPESIEADREGSTIDSFTLRSENSGDITETLTARMNAEGSDRLHIGGRLRGVRGMLITGTRAGIPMSVDYE